MIWSSCVAWSLASFAAGPVSRAERAALASRQTASACVMKAVLLSAVGPCWAGRALNGRDRRGVVAAAARSQQRGRHEGAREQEVCAPAPH